ncbi:macrophage mannose receptor 1-like [Poeciliopsis prolifica]|uniref:macrophage mannose receptor 1-like n=1 Tax=Poeciliopsis prolifica TaxID=188132 RepID=UPI0024145439|nr:macrophage mannose receptor 1-like [Poeciliopsis prolifica]
MERLIWILAAFGLSSTSRLPEHKFVFVDELKNWTEARRFCRETYIDLATLESQQEVEALNDLATSVSKTSKVPDPLTAQNEGRSLAWIGLYDDVNSWRWSMSDSDVYQHEEKEFSNWQAGQPNNAGGQENCGEMNADGSWNDASCSKGQDTICLQLNGSSVILQILNWTEAQSYCRKHHTDLARVRSLAENQQASNSFPRGNVWIGLFRDSWKWVGAKNFSFRFWNKGNNEPGNNGKEECAAAHFGRSGQWEDWPCDQHKAFVCYSELCGNASHPGRKYFFVGEMKNWTEAQSHCREHYGNLAVMENMEDVETLNNMAASLGFTSAAWIGLYDDVNSWRWSVSESDLDKHQEKHFTNWNPGEPNNEAGKESCVEMVDDGYWNDVPCSKLQGSICSQVRGSDVQFTLINVNMNWTAAQSYCRNHYTDLARVRNMTDIQNIKVLIPAGKKVWIGFHRPFWMWVDGSSFSFSYWGSSEPNGAGENCALADLGNSGRWEDWDCDGHRPFICYSVVCGNSTLPTREYIIVDELKTWTEAQRYCRENHKDLATITSMEDVRNVTATSAGRTNRTWIGLHEDVNSWRWSMSDQYQNQFRNWAAGEPDNKLGRESCGALSADGSWYDVSCSQTLATVCFNVSGTNATFYYSSTKRNWTEAQSFCREHYTDLASVRNPSDNEAIRGSVHRAAWLGLYRDSWKWADGRNSSFRNWNRDETQQQREGGMRCCSLWERWEMAGLELQREESLRLLHCGPVKACGETAAGASIVCDGGRLCHDGGTPDQAETEAAGRWSKRRRETELEETIRRKNPPQTKEEER